MQTQDAPAEFIFKLWPWLETNRNRLIGTGVAILAVFAIYNFMASQKAQKEVAAGQALTQLLMSPPSGTNPAEALKKLATQYAGTQAAQRAQLQAAASLFSAGNYVEAQAAFQQSVDASVGGPLTGTALLGVAASLEAQGKLDLAAAAYQKVASTYSGSPSALPALCALGRIAEQQGKLTEALNRYEAASRAGNLGGSLAQEATFHASEIKAKLAAAPKAAAVVPAK